MLDGGERESLHRIALELIAREHPGIHHLIAPRHADDVAHLESARREGVVIDLWRASRRGGDGEDLPTLGMPTRTRTARYRPASAAVGVVPRCQ